MIADLGRAGLLVALMLAVYVVVVGIAAGRWRRVDLLLSVRNAVYALTAMLTVASLALCYSLATKDYSLRFVANYTNNEAPINYAVASFWAGNAGSLLLWAAVLAIVTSAVAYQTTRRYAELAPYILATLGGVAIFFLTMVNFLDNPFTPMSPRPIDGRGLNPLLENFWMQIHPPSLYLGYITMAAPFAFAVAALVTKRLDDEWIKASHTWTLV
ncbi:MAG: cytochrome c biogenesis protein CcsA, partial [Dehalococcoidia bacterium]|nr:cytochrome c biogenesis protein CcsA [Dehalococcoidia bacterium]